MFTPNFDPRPLPTRNMIGPGRHIPTQHRQPRTVSVLTGGFAVRQFSVREDGYVGVQNKTTASYRPDLAQRVFAMVDAPGFARSVQLDEKPNLGCGGGGGSYLMLNDQWVTADGSSELIDLLLEIQRQVCTFK